LRAGAGSPEAAHFGTVSAQLLVLGGGILERMFETLDEAQALVQADQIGRQARWRMLVSNCEQVARLTQQNTQIVRRADDAGDWRVAGCASIAEW
jgi:hypothetical protein